MSKVILYIAQSLDGFISTADGGVEWLEGFNLPNEDYGYHAMYGRLDAVIMGGATYRQVLGFGYPYEGVKSYILTRGTLDNLPKPEIYAFSGAVDALVHKIRAETTKDMWLIGGADVVAQFMAKNLIDEYHITTMPVLLGEGIRLFTGVALDKSQKVTLSDVRHYANGVTQTIYFRGQ